MEKAKKIIFENRFAQFVVFLICGAVIILTIQYINESKSTVRGSFALHDTRLDFKDNEQCSGSGGYEDIKNGTQVEVSNGSGEIIGVSSLENGTMDGASVCKFNFTLENIPRADIYQFEVANRGEVTYSKDKLKENNYKVELSLGD